MLQSDKWSFSEPRNVATFTVRQIIDLELPILLVCHDQDDGSWQFLTGTTLYVKDAMLVALEEIVRRDPTVVELHDLPCGWEAYRSNPKANWIRRMKKTDQITNEQEVR